MFIYIYISLLHFYLERVVVLCLFGQCVHNSVVELLSVCVFPRGSIAMPSSVRFAINQILAKKMLSIFHSVRGRPP